MKKIKFIDHIRKAHYATCTIQHYFSILTCAILSDWKPGHYISRNPLPVGFQVIFCQREPLVRDL